MKDILYEDKDIIVVRKQAGLATQSAGVGQQDLVSILKKHIVEGGNAQTPPYLGMIHRLDQPVEGLLVFAKNQRAAGQLSRQLQQGALNKDYFAVLCGKPKTKSAQLVDYVAKDKKNCAFVVTEKDAEFSQGKKAILSYRVLDEVELDSSKELALVQIQIETGRFHQIRIQFAHLGFPLLGDGKYGTINTKKIAGELSVPSVSLCAYGLEFDHPVTKKRMTFHITPQGKGFSYFAKEIYLTRGE